MKFERSERNVGNRVVKGAAFMVLARLLLRLFSLANLVILGRLLSPGDYGVAAAAIAVISVIAVISDLRVNQALIAIKSVDPVILDTGFTLTLLRGLLVAAVLLLFAGPIATLAGEPRLAEVLRILAIVPIFDGLRNPAFTLFARNIDFSREFQRTALATLIGFIAAVTFAILTRSYWAIVAGTIAGRGMEALFSYWRVPYRPGLSLKGWRTFFSFGGWLTLSAILSEALVHAPTLLMTRFVGAGPAGLYSVGLTVARLATRELAAPLMQAIFPGLATLADRPQALRQAYRQAQSGVLALALPLGFGTAMLAPQFIALTAGEKWLPQSAWVAAILGPAMALLMLGASIDSLALARRSPRSVAARSLAIFVLGFPLLAWGAIHHGLFGVVWASAAIRLIDLLLRLLQVQSLIGGSLLDAFVAGWRSFAAAGLMVLVLWLWPAADPVGRGEFLVAVDLILHALLAAAVYGGVHLLLWNLSGRPAGPEAKAMAALAALRRRLGLA